MTEILTSVLVVVAAFAAGAMSHYRWLKELEDRLNRLERKTIWK